MAVGSGTRWPARAGGRGTSTGRRGREILVSGELLARLDGSTLRRKRWHTKLKGTPRDLQIYAIDRA